MSSLTLHHGRPGALVVEPSKPCEEARSYKEKRAMFATRLSPRTMSFTRAALAAALVAVLATIPNAHAADTSQDMMPAGYSSLMKMKPVQVMHMMDPDKKGYVTKSDFMKFHERMFEKMDKNHDDKLSEAEFVEKTHTGP
jgi:hypothetical protein